MNYKCKIACSSFHYGKIISQSMYNSLPWEKQTHFEPVEEAEQKRSNSDDAYPIRPSDTDMPSWTLPDISTFDISPSNDSSSSSSDFGGFSGGDTGGGGTSGDW